MGQSGPNQFVFHRSRSPWILFLHEFKALFPLLLVSSGLAYLADFLSPNESNNFIAAALLGVVILNAVVSFLQNYRVEKLMVTVPLFVLTYL